MSEERLVLLSLFKLGVERCLCYCYFTGILRDRDKQTDRKRERHTHTQRQTERQTDRVSNWILRSCQQHRLHQDEERERGEGEGGRR